MKGTTYKRCGCRNPETGKPWGRACSKLKRRNGSWNPDHGIWHLQAELPPRSDGTRRPLRKGGYTAQRDADADLERIRTLLALAQPHDTPALTAIADAIETAHRTKEPLPSHDDIKRHIHTGIAATDLPTIGDYLDHWLTSRRTIAASTLRSYGTHIRRYLIPHLGTIRLDKLRRHHVVSLFDAIDEHNDTIRTARASTDPHVQRTVRGVRPTGPATQQRIRATLRVALNKAITDGLITHNPATLIELASGKPPKPVVWTPARIQRWRTTGRLPSPVMVWTPELTGEFLDHAIDDELYPLFHLIALRGLRRGEACGLPWTNVDLTAATITIDTQIIQLGWETQTSTPKSEASNRVIPLDTVTTSVLENHHERQHHDKALTGDDWHDTGLVFTHKNGEPWHPADLSSRFKTLLDTADLPPIRLHDLRHGAATLTLAAGADMKTVQELLGHSTYTLTANTYTSILPTYARTAAQNTANLIPRNTNN
jgi:integrase